MANQKTNNISDKFNFEDKNLSNAFNEIQKLIPQDRSLFLLDKEPTVTDTDNFDEDKIYRYNENLYIKVNNKIIKLNGTEI